MWHFSMRMEFGKIPEDDNEPIPGEGGPGNAQVEDAGYGSTDVKGMGTGSCLPES